MNSSSPMKGSIKSPSKPRDSNTQPQVRQWRTNKHDHIVGYKFKEKLVRLIYKDKKNHVPKYFLGMNEKYLNEDSLIFDSDFE